MRTRSLLVLVFFLLASSCSFHQDQPNTPGSISGKILIDQPDPMLRIYAREITSGDVYWIEPGEGAASYTITGLAPGTYLVVGWFYPLGASGAYTSLDTVMAVGEEQMLACDGAMIEIDLSPGEEFTGADVGCWGGDFFDYAE